MMPLYENWHSNEVGDHYLLLDGAGHDNIQGVLYELSPNAVWRPLYLGTEYEELLQISPILIAVDSDSPMLGWFLETAENWQHGICLQSEKYFNAVLTQLQSLIKATLYGYLPVFFRFYDPAILAVCADSFTPQEKERLLGPVDSWHWISADEPYSWSELGRSRSNRLLAAEYDKLLEEKQKVPFEFSEHTIQAYQADKDAKFLLKMNDFFAQKGLRFEEDFFNSSARAAVAQGRAYGLTYESSLSMFTLFWLTVSPDFHLATGIKDIFEKNDMHELEKIELVSDAML